MNSPTLPPSTLARIKPLVAELKAIGDRDFVRLGGILRQIEYHCQAPVEIAGFEQPENPVVYMGVDLN